jgi:hypothetical protein
MHYNNFLIPWLLISIDPRTSSVSDSYKSVSFQNLFKRRTRTASCTRKLHEYEFYKDKLSYTVVGTRDL